MKKLMIAALMLTLLVPSMASAERLAMQVTDMLYINAELPENTPEALPILTVAPHPMDADQLHRLLMPDNTLREDVDDPGDRYVMFGTGDGESEYMLVELDFGRVCYNSKFWDMHLRDVIQTGDEMTDTLNYYPEDREAEGLSRADALKQAQELIDELGLSVAPDARVLTIDQASYAHMLEELSISDKQAEIPRRYLEPYDPAHDGYFMQFSRTVGGVPEFDRSLLQLEIFISRQGIEYLETGFVKDTVQSGEPQKLLSAEEALKAAVPQMIKAEEKGYYVAGSYLEFPDKATASTVERIRLGYRYDRNTKAMTPIWEYTFPRAMWNDEGTWETRTFDNPAFLGIIQINAITGEYIQAIQD